MKADNPDVPFPEMAKLLGAAWNDATPDEKAVYQEQHAVSISSQALLCMRSFILNSLQVQRLAVDEFTAAGMQTCRGVFVLTNDLCGCRC